MEDLKAMMIPLLVVFALFIGGITILALRNKVIFKMGARNLPRRPANTVLTCLGLMLAAMIFSASFATGDTVNHSIRTQAVRHLGQVDIMVMPDGVAFGGETQQVTLESGVSTVYFDQDKIQIIENALADLKARGIVEGIAPAIIERKPALSPSTHLNEPMAVILGLDYRAMQAFDPLVAADGTVLSLQGLAEGGGSKVYINRELADNLSDSTHRIGTGDNIATWLKSIESDDSGSGTITDLLARATVLEVAGVYERGGNPTIQTFGADSVNSLVMPLEKLQALRAAQVPGANENQIDFILISNRGGAIDGAAHTDEVMAALEPALQGTGLRAQTVKQDELDSAEEEGSQISTMFLIFGSFSIIAGIMLIFLIFIMLAAERKQELGMIRAVGAQQGHIVRMFTFEGVLYAVVASAVGAALGLLVCWAMIEIIRPAMENVGIQIDFHFTTSGLFISYALGVVLTLVVVFFSARSVSRLNIISAIKDIPEPRKPEQRGFRGAIMGILLPLFALIMLVIGLMAKNWTPYALGASLLIIGIFMLARRYLGMSDRISYTLTGVLLLIFWLLPSRYHPYGEEMVSGIEMFILSGVMMVAGAVWVVMYNSDLLLRAIMAIFGRIRMLAPILKPAVSYPLASRFRTGMAVAMFSLVVFTLIVMSIINASFNHLLNDTQRVTGSFDIRAEVVNPVPDMNAALDSSPGLSRSDFQAVGAISIIPRAQLRDAGQGGEWHDFPLMGVDGGYLDNVTFDFHLKAKNYQNATKEQMWQTLKNNEGLAVLSSDMVPQRGGGHGGGAIDLVIGEGRFYLDDDYMPDDIYIEVLNPKTGDIDRLQVIGVTDVMAAYALPVTTSAHTLQNISGSVVISTSYRFRVAHGLEDQVPTIAKTLEQQFLASGMNTEVLKEEIDDFSAINNMFMNLMMAFMGLGLIVGIAALGVIAARSVVERRHQIGMLRAIGFRQGMVQFSFLLETSFIAVLGITIGVVLGVALAYQMLPDWDVEGIRAVMPWGQVVIVTLLAYLASLLTTYLPAYRAARIYPAEALRYE